MAGVTLGSGPCGQPGLRQLGVQSALECPLAQAQRCGRGWHRALHTSRLGTGTIPRAERGLFLARSLSIALSGVPLLEGKEGPTWLQHRGQDWGREKGAGPGAAGEKGSELEPGCMGSQVGTGAEEPLGAVGLWCRR